MPPLRSIFRTSLLFAILNLPSFAAEDQALRNLAPNRDLSTLHFSKLDLLAQAAVGRIHAITQGPDGFMWIGTQQGLFRYDGHRLKKFQNDSNEPTSLTDDTVWSLHLDSQDRLWIGTRHGISLYHPKTESFENFLSPNTTELPKGYHRVNSILNCEKNLIYASSETGHVFRFNESERVFEKLNEQSLGLIKSMSIDSENALWIGAANQLHRLSPADGQIKTFTNGLDSPDGITNNYITSICPAAENKLWLGTSSRGAFLFDTDGPLHQPAPLVQTSLDFVNQVSADPHGRIWIASNNGITIYDQSQGDAVKHTPHSLDSRELPPNGINTMWSDHQGNLWVGSNFDGLAISVRFKPFHSVPVHKTRDDLPAHAPIAAFLEDRKGNLWIGHKREGVTMYPANGDTPKAFKPNPSNSNAISGSPILRIFQDSKDNIWFGTYRDGLFKYRPETDDFLRIAHDPSKQNSISGHDIRDFAEDSQGFIWIAMHETGVSKFNPETGSFTHYRKAQADEYGIQIKNDWVNALLVDQQDRVWIGSPVGITRIEADRTSAVHLKSEPTQAGSLSNPLVYDIYEDSTKRVWVATADGLNLYNPSDETFTRFGTDIGLPHKSISSVLEDNSGNIWLGTLDGLAKFDPESSSVRTYRQNDGLVSDDFFENSAAATKAGKLYFGQSRGLTFFDPAEIQDDTLPPNVFITGIRLFNTPLGFSETSNNYPRLNQSILHTSSLALKHSQNAITFEFTALDYLDPQRNRYSFILEGQDQKWTHTQSQFEATYTNLSPGRYAFKVTASNNDGYRNELGDSIEIVIQPPVWGTLWFRLTASIMAISLPVIFYRVRISNMRKEAKRLEHAVDQRTSDLKEANNRLAQANRQILQHREELEKTVTLRTKELEIAKSNAEHSDKLKSAFLANMSHEIRTPMNAIVGFLHILESNEISENERNQYGRIIRKSSESLMSLIDDILDLSTIEAGQAEISPKPTNVESICEELGALFRESLSSHKKGEVKYRHFADIPQEYQSVSDLSFYIDPHRLKQILWNLLSNALKFTDKGEVALGYEIAAIPGRSEEYQIRFTVKDTGIGIPKEEHESIFNRFHKLNADQEKLYRGTGLGLAITLTLTELMEGEIELESEPGKGSCFLVTFPFKPVAISPLKQSLDLSESPARLDTDFSNCTLLLVEDEQPNYDYIIRALSLTGAKIRWAQTGHEALELFNKHNFDLILLDLKIPGIDGYEVARQIRAAGSDIPIIAQSAFAMASDHTRSIEAGANEHLVKPFRPQELIDTLTRYLPTPRN